MGKWEVRSKIDGRWIIFTEAKWVQIHCNSFASINRSVDTIDTHSHGHDAHWETVVCPSEGILRAVFSWLHSARKTSEAIFSDWANISALVNSAAGNLICLLLCAVACYCFVHPIWKKRNRIAKAIFHSKSNHISKSTWELFCFCFCFVFFAICLLFALYAEELARSPTPN